MSIVAFLRKLRRKLTPPGNRGSLDTEYRQPSGAAEPSDLEQRPEHLGNWAGPWGAANERRRLGLHRLAQRIARLGPV